jgi:putative ABC transport system substrate-binding protein
MDEFQALVLIPDVSLLTAAVMEQMFLYSFRKNIPLLGISESNVRQGSLYALVFEPAGLGRQLGEMAAAVLNGAGAGSIAQAAPRTYNLYLNMATARKMGIPVPDELVRRAKKVY